MTAPFNNFLSGNRNPAFNYKSYAHATGLYVDGNRMPRLPKLGFIYFISFKLNPQVNALVNKSWKDDLGFLAKKVDLPKFKVATQTVNQYNRKTNVQTKLTYDPLTIDFHDDNSEITSLLWRLYYQYYFSDGRNSNGLFGPEFKGDTKYNQTAYSYGYAPKSAAQKPFFESVDIFVLHQGNFSQYSISNPIVSQWDHDQLDQSQGTKVLANKITLQFDSVAYFQGTIKADPMASMAFNATWYDNIQNLTGAYADPADAHVPPPVPQYPTPQPAGMSLSQLDKSFGAQTLPVVIPPRPLGAGTFGLSSFRPPGLGFGSLDVWYGYGGMHVHTIVNAGPLRLVFNR